MCESCANDREFISNHLEEEIKKAGFKPDDVITSTVHPPKFSVFVDGVIIAQQREHSKLDETGITTTEKTTGIVIIGWDDIPELTQILAGGFMAHKFKEEEDHDDGSST